MKPLYPVAQLRDELHAIDRELDAPLRIHMIGGGALGFHGLKDRTKDVDIVTTSRQDADRLAAVLEDLGYDALKEPAPEYERLKAAYLYGKPRHAQWDIYVRLVCGKLRLSPGMQERAGRLESGLRHLDVRVVAPQDILVFKSITERPADRVDMEAIHASGPDWAGVLQEMEWQARHSDQPWGADFHAAMETLDRDGFAVPILDDLQELARHEMEEWAVLYLLQNGPMPVQRIVDRLAPELEEGESPQVIRYAIGRLEEAGRVTVDGAGRAAARISTPPFR